MTATDELRRLLDERGVRWWNDFAALHRSDYTHFEPDAGMTVCAWEKDGGLALEVSTDYRLTPEQAIAATLGTGTCRDDSEAAPIFFSCSECGCCHLRNVAYVDMPRYCPNCGRKVVRA